MNFKGKIIFDQSKPDGILKKPSSNTVFNKCFNDFKWTSLEEGINSSIEYFTKNYPNIRK